MGKREPPRGWGAGSSGGCWAWPGKGLGPGPPQVTVPPGEAGGVGNTGRVEPCGALPPHSPRSAPSPSSAGHPATRRRGCLLPPPLRCSERALRCRAPGPGRGLCPRTCPRPVPLMADPVALRRHEHGQAGRLSGRRPDPRCCVLLSNVARPLSGQRLSRGWREPVHRGAHTGCVSKTCAGHPSLGGVSAGPGLHRPGLWAALGGPLLGEPRSDMAAGPPGLPTSQRRSLRSPPPLVQSTGGLCLTGTVTGPR